MNRRLDDECLKRVEKLLEVYHLEVEESDLAPDTKRTYLRHAETFVRWLAGDFTPGVNVGG